MTPDQLREHGEAIFGYGWQSALARNLNVASRTVRRWVAGESPIPADVAARVVALAESLDATPVGRPAYEAMREMLEDISEQSDGWAAGRDDDVIYIAHRGEIVGTAVWDGGIKNPRLAIPEDERDGMDAALRAARRERVGGDRPSG